MRFITLVNELELRDNVQPDLGEFVLKHLEEHGQQVINSPVTCEKGGFQAHHHENNSLLLAQDRCQTTDLRSKRSSDMLGSIRNEVFDAAHDIVEKSVAIDEGAESGDLAGDGRPDFGLVILQKLDKCRDKIPRNNLLVNGLGDLYLD